MNCCQCQGLEELFNPKSVARELAQYRAKGPDKTTRMLIEALQEADLQGLSLLDIGGGVGAIQHALLKSGVQNATDIDASSAYLNAAREEAERRGLSERVHFEHGNFVDLAEQLSPADVVTLDRVICCYPDMQKMVGLSTARTRKLYGLVYPRDAWWIRIGLVMLNFFFRLSKNPYRTFVHPTQAVEDLINRSGLTQRFYRRTLVWQVVVYSR
jgi:predicted TPR repeat methyltransferase